MSDQVPPFNPAEHELIYKALADHIITRIDAGELRPGARLPAERDIALEYGVAYMTVRRATQELRERGRIITVYGRGTFVTPLGQEDEPNDDEGQEEDDGPDQ